MRRLLRRLLLATACVALTGAAPAVPREPVPPAPPGARVWRPGHWQWNGSTYDWVGGNWLRRPTGTARQDGHWLLRRGAWVWVPPH